MDEISRLMAMRDYLHDRDPAMSREISQKLEHDYGIVVAPVQKSEEAPRLERAVNPQVPVKRSRRS